MLFAEAMYKAFDGGKTLQVTLQEADLGARHSLLNCLQGPTEKFRVPED